MAPCPFKIRHGRKQKQTKYKPKITKELPFTCRILPQSVLCPRLFRNSHLHVFLLRMAFFVFLAACVLLIFVSHTCLWTCSFRVFAFLCVQFFLCNHDVTRVAAMVARDACHLLSVISHAVCCAHSWSTPVATCSGVQSDVPLESPMN